MTLEERLENILDFLPEGYDTSVGSFFYDILYPIAEQIYLKEEVIDGITDNVFAKTAEGDYLDWKVAEQGIARNVATYATGEVTIDGTEGSIIHKGTKVASTDILFSVDENTTIPEGGSVNVPITCTISGEKGNVAAGQITRFPISYPGLQTVINKENITGGYDAESDDELRERYFEKVSRPNASGNVNQYIGWAKTVNGVGNVQVVPLWNGPGTVKVVITNDSNQPAADELVSEVKAYIEENRPIGAEVTVESAKTQKISIGVTITTSADTATVTNDLKTVIQDYLSNTAIDKGYASYAKIGALILTIDDVEDYSKLTVNGTTSNIDISTGYVPVLSEVNIVWE